MDFIQDYIHLLPKLLPPSLFSTLISISTTAFGIFKMLQTHISPFLGRLLLQPDLSSILLLLVIAFISFKIVDMAYRAVMFWVFLAYRLVVWGAIITIGLWVYNRGLEGFVDDVRDLADYWTEQYQKYSDEVKYFQSQKEEQIRQQNRGYMRW